MGWPEGFPEARNWPSVSAYGGGCISAHGFSPTPFPFRMLHVYHTGPGIHLLGSDLPEPLTGVELVPRCPVGAFLFPTNKGQSFTLRLVAL